MRLLSVNVGERRIQPKRDGPEITGIYKLPTQGPVQITRLGIPGDFIGDLKNHGGEDQAVYVYGEVDYAWWSQELGHPLEPGTFGENLTLAALESAGFNIGDRFHIGSTVLEVTAPRIPCSTLARRMSDPMFVRLYRRAERPGLYCRVIHEGPVSTGDEVTLETRIGETVKAIEIFREHYAVEKHEGALRRFLTAPIASRTRVDVEKRLARLPARS